MSQSKNVGNCRQQNESACNKGELSARAPVKGIGEDEFFMNAPIGREPLFFMNLFKSFSVEIRCDY